MARGLCVVLERNVHVYKRQWPFFLAGMLEPMVYLLGVGYGIGSIVDSVRVNGHAVPYQVYVSPGLMASAAMNGALLDALFGVFWQLRYAGTFAVMLSARITLGAVSLGSVMWATVRSAVYATTFFGVLLAFGITTPGSALMVPAAVLVGFAFAAAGTASATVVRSWGDFDLFNVVLLPMFLFSGTFFPVQMYPSFVQAVMQASPLYRGVDLLRAIALGVVRPNVAIDVTYLLALGVAGSVLAARRLSSELWR